MSFFVYENTLVRPLYYDALSGEFYPPSDQENRAHTLGRLAFASILKGEKTSNDFGATEHRYIPSWAPNVITVAGCIYDNDMFNSGLVRLSLQSANHSLNLLDAVVQESESSGIIIASEVRVDELPLILGPEIATARNATTEAAQVFFDQAYAELNQ